MDFWRNEFLTLSGHRQIVLERPFSDPVRRRPCPNSNHVRRECDRGQVKVFVGRFGRFEFFLLKPFLPRICRRQNTLFPEKQYFPAEKRLSLRPNKKRSRITKRRFSSSIFSSTQKEIFYGQIETVSSNHTPLYVFIVVCYGSELTRGPCLCKRSGTEVEREKRNCGIAPSLSIQWKLLLRNQRAMPPSHKTDSNSLRPWDLESQEIRKFSGNLWSITQGFSGNFGKIPFTESASQSLTSRTRIRRTTTSKKTTDNTASGIPFIWHGTICESGKYFGYRLWICFI